MYSYHVACAWVRRVTSDHLRGRARSASDMQHIQFVRKCKENKSLRSAAKTATYTDNRTNLWDCMSSIHVDWTLQYPLLLYKMLQVAACPYTRVMNCASNVSHYIHYAPVPIANNLTCNAVVLFSVEIALLLLGWALDPKMRPINKGNYVWYPTYVPNLGSRVQCSRSLWKPHNSRQQTINYCRAEGVQFLVDCGLSALNIMRCFPHSLVTTHNCKGNVHCFVASDALSKPVALRAQLRTNQLIQDVELSTSHTTKPVELDFMNHVLHHLVFGLVSVCPQPTPLGLRGLFDQQHMSQPLSF